MTARPRRANDPRLEPSKHAGDILGFCWSTIHMSVRSLWILPLVLCLTSCDHSLRCAPIQAATHVVVRSVSSPSGVAADRDVADPSLLRQLMDFANAHRTCSKPETYTMPAPTTNVMFYRGSVYEGAIGAGGNFLFVGCESASGIRPATDEELKSFAYLTSVSL